MVSCVRLSGQLLQCWDHSHSKRVCIPKGWLHKHRNSHSHAERRSQSQTVGGKVNASKVDKIPYIEREIFTWCKISRFSWTGSTKIKTTKISAKLPDGIGGGFHRDRQLLW